VSKARRASLFSPTAGEVVSTAPLLAWRRAESDVLQRPALPWRSPDHERLAKPTAASAARRVDAPRTTNGAEPREVRLVRLAGFRRSRARTVRQFARPKHVPGPIRKPRSCGARKESQCQTKVWHCA
jgi:hypothetical protein